MTKPTLFAAALACAALCVGASASTTKSFAPVPTPAAVTLAAPADPDHFTFIVAGDNRSTGHGYPMPPAFAEICREIGWIHPDFTFWTGDVIEGYGDTVAEANAEYDTFLQGASLTGRPVFNAPGNHEYSLDAALLPVYQKRLGSLYGSFDYGHSHFIALDTSPVGADGTIKGGTIDDAQMKWLQSDLAANHGAKNIFVFMHHYVFGPPDPDAPSIDTGFVSIEARDRLHAVLLKGGVRAVFCSHNHIYWHQEKDGIAYFISGGAGAPLDASPENGGYLHFVEVSVDGAKITTQIEQPWHLEVDYPDGEAAHGPSGRVWVANTNNEAVLARHIVLHVAAPPVGQTLVVTAGVAYKNNSKLGEARIVAQILDGKGGEEVVVEAALKPHRTTEISVSPAAPKTLANP